MHRGAYAPIWLTCRVIRTTATYRALAYSIFAREVSGAARSERLLQHEFSPGRRWRWSSGRPSSEGGCEGAHVDTALNLSISFLYPSPIPHAELPTAVRTTRSVLTKSLLAKQTITPQCTYIHRRVASGCEGGYHTCICATDEPFKLVTRECHLHPS